MTSIGETLRRERLRRNLSLEQISRQTKISTRLLGAIEDEQFDKLPGGVFTRSFVRQYAGVLGLDQDEFSSELAEILRPAEPAPSPGEAGAPGPPLRLPRVAVFEGSATRLKPGSSLPAFALVVAVMLLCSAIYAWWQRSRHPQAPAAPAAQTTVAANPPREPVVPAAAHQASAPASAPARPVKAPASAGNTAARSLNEDEAQQPNPQQSAVLGTPGGTVQVGLNAKEVTWVKVWSDGKAVFEGTLRPNQTQAINASGKVRIRVGNAGGLDATLNGKPVGPLGRRGQISVVQFSPEGTQVVPIEPFADEGDGPIERRPPLKPKASPDAAKTGEADQTANQPAQPAAAPQADRAADQPRAPGAEHEQPQASANTPKPGTNDSPAVDRELDC